MTASITVTSLRPNRRKVIVETLEPGSDKAVDPPVVVLEGGSAVLYVHQAQRLVISEQET